MLAILSTLSASANIIPQADVYWDQIITKGEVSGLHHMPAFSPCATAPKT